jgi:hypothetical protein
MQSGREAHQASDRRRGSLVPSLLNENRRLTSGNWLSWSNLRRE